MCAAWPCCDDTYTVRKYRPDGSTHWVRNYGAPADPAKTPIDVAVGSDGRVFVIGDRCVLGSTAHSDFQVGGFDDREDGEAAWDLRCYSATGETLWWADCWALRDFQDSRLGVVVRLDVDAADRVHVLLTQSFTAIGAGSSFVTQQVLKFSRDGALLSNDVISFLYPFLQIRRHFAVAADGSVLALPDVVAHTGVGFFLHDVAAVGGGAWLSVGPNVVPSPGAWHFGPTVLFAADPEHVPLEQYLLHVDFEWLLDDAPVEALGVASDEHGLANIRGPHVFDDGQPHQLVQIEVDPAAGAPAPPFARRGAIGAVRWAHRCRMTHTRGQIDMSRTTGRSVTALAGAFDGPGHLRWPSVACLDRDGRLEWAHFHGGDILEVALGEDQSVATICPPRRRGVREWERLDALTEA